MIAIDILREEMHKANGHLTVWQEDWIIKAMERYAEQQVKNCSIPDVSNSVCSHPDNKTILSNEILYCENCMKVLKTDC